jgi:hypothetical protein
MSLPTTESKWKLSWIIPSAIFVSVAIVVLVRLNLLLSAHLTLAVAASVRQAVISFDYSIVSFLNRFAHRSWTFDTVFYLIDGNAPGAMPLAVGIWWAWFK